MVGAIEWVILPVDHWIAAQSFDLILIFLVDFHLFKFFLGNFDGVALQKNVKDGTLFHP